jgi:Gluconate 2-dehydrogenase subunit 3
MKLSRRDALKTIAAAPVISRLQAGAPDLDQASLAALADIVLPAEADRKAALAAFTRWIDNYTEGADTDHGYGVTRVRPTGPSPARHYPAQIAALDAAARAAGATGFAAAAPAQRRAIVEAAIADAKIERLPARPSGGHIATDLMGHYFNSSAANDLCYRAEINRDACRGLAGSDLPPKGADLRPEGRRYLQIK